MPQTEREPQSWKKDLDKMRDDLHGMADDLRVRVHLAGMDAKDAWNKLEPKLFDFEKRAEGAVQKTSDELKDLAQDLKQRMKRLRDSL
jgi:hypothetical protein